MIKITHNLSDGEEVVFIEDENGIRVIKLVSHDELVKNSLPYEEVLKIITQSHQEAIDLENK